MNNQSISLDGSSVVYATEFIRVSETGTSSIKQDFATITYLASVSVVSCRLTCLTLAARKHPAPRGTWNRDKLRAPCV